MVKWIVVLLGIAVAIEISNHYQEKEKLEQPVITENLLSEFDKYLAAFPMGATKEEVFSKAHEIDGKTELKYSQMYGTDYKKTSFSGYEAGLLFVISHRNDGPSSLRKMKITMLSGNAPVEEIYRQLHQTFSGRYAHRYRKDTRLTVILVQRQGKMARVLYGKSLLSEAIL